MNQKYEKLIPYIKKYYNTKTQTQLAKELNVSRKLIYNIAKKINIYENKKESIIDSNENFEKYLKKYYGKKTIKELSIDLKCGETTISKYAKKLNLVKEYSIWSIEENNILKKYHNINSYIGLKMKLKKIGKNRTIEAIKKQIRILNLETNYTENGYYLTSKEVEELLGIYKWNLDSYVKSNKIKVSKFKGKRRFDIDDLKKFLVKFPYLWDAKNTDIDTLKILIAENVEFENYHKNNLNEIILNKIKNDLSKTNKNTPTFVNGR